MGFGINPSGRRRAGHGSACRPTGRHEIHVRFRSHHVRVTVSRGPPSRRPAPVPVRVAGLARRWPANDLRSWTATDPGPPSPDRGVKREELAGSWTPSAPAATARAWPARSRPGQGEPPDTGLPRQPGRPRRQRGSAGPRRRAASGKTPGQRPAGAVGGCPPIHLREAVRHAGGGDLVAFAGRDDNRRPAAVRWSGKPRVPERQPRASATARGGAFLRRPARRPCRGRAGRPISSGRRMPSGEGSRGLQPRGFAVHGSRWSSSSNQPRSNRQILGARPAGKASAPLGCAVDGGSIGDDAVRRRWLATHGGPMKSPARRSGALRRPRLPGRWAAWTPEHRPGPAVVNHLRCKRRCNADNVRAPALAPSHDRASG
jgi:hypothetical protein